MTQKTKEETMMENRVKAVTLQLEELVKWYLLNNGGVGPKQIIEDRPGYQARVFRYLDPPIPYIDNPVLVEGYEGGFWVLRVEKRTT